MSLFYLDIYLISEKKNCSGTVVVFLTSETAIFYKCLLKKLL